MAWELFPLPAQSGYARSVLAYNELRTACIERGLGTPTELKNGDRLRASHITSLRSAILNNVDRFVRVVSTGATTYDIRKFTSGTTQPLSPPSFGWQNIFEHVLGEGKTTWQTSALAGRKADVTDVLNECYEVLDAIRIRRHDLTTVTVHQEAKSLFEFDNDSWAKTKSDFAALSWVPGGYPTHTAFATYEYRLPPPDGNNNDLKQITMNRCMECKQATLLNTPPRNNALVGLYLYWVSTLTGNNFNTAFSYRHGTGTAPTTVTGARSFGESLYSVSKSGSGTTREEDRLQSFSASGLNAGDVYKALWCLPSTYDSFTAWDLPDPPNNGSTTTGWGDGWSRGRCDWICIDYNFEKLSS